MLNKINSLIIIGCRFRPPHSIALGADEKYLYVTDAGHSAILAYDISNQEGFWIRGSLTYFGDQQSLSPLMTSMDLIIVKPSCRFLGICYHKSTFALYMCTP